MKIFFDTEFTGLHKNTTLISIGCIAEDGKTFYAELNDFDESQCDNWIQENVINNLLYPDVEGVKDDGTNMVVLGDMDLVREKFIEWLSQYKDVQFVSDVCHYDMVLLIDIFGDAMSLPQGVSPVCHDINQDIARFYGCPDAEVFDWSREDIIAEHHISIEGKKHNSLYDAKVIEAIYHIVNN